MGIITDKVEALQKDSTLKDWHHNWTYVQLMQAIYKFTSMWMEGRVPILTASSALASARPAGESIRFTACSTLSMWP